MTIQLELWHAILLGLSFLGFVFGAGKVLFAQIDQRLDTRFTAMEESRKQSQTHWDARFGELAEQNRREAEGWQRIEREFLIFKADLPIQYVRREDFVRNQTIIEAKLDQLRMSIENQYLKGLKND